MHHTPNPSCRRADESAALLGLVARSLGLSASLLHRTEAIRACAQRIGVRLCLWVCRVCAQLISACAKHTALCCCACSVHSTCAPSTHVAPATVTRACGCVDNLHTLCGRGETVSSLPPVPCLPLSRCRRRLQVYPMHTSCTCTQVALIT